MMIRPWHCLALGVALAVTPAFGSKLHRVVASSHGKHLRHGSKRLEAVSHGPVGQRGIDPERAREIQAALIQHSYLTGEPTGEWDAQTEAAMTKFQADNGWQTKLIPDSRALIKLGLGPNGAAGSENVGGPVAASTTVAASSEANTLATAHSILN